MNLILGGKSGKELSYIRHGLSPDSVLSVMAKAQIRLIY